MGIKTEAEETTLDLDKAMEEGMEKFAGELEEAAADDTPPATPGKDSPQAGEEVVPPVKAIEDPDQEASEAAAAAAGDDLEKDKSGGEALQNRFPDHAAAEEGYKNIQSEKTRVEQENKELREKLDASGKKEEREAAVAVAEEKIENFSIERHKEALGAIDELDPDADNYTGEVSRIMTRKDRDIRRFETENMPAADSGAAAATAHGTQDDDTDPNAAAKKYVKETATAADIDPEHRYFKRVCAQAPLVDEAGKEISFEDQVAWAVNETKDFLAEQETDFTERQKEAAKKKADEHQDKSLSLGTGGILPPPAGKEDDGKPVTLEDALQSADQERTI